MKLFILTLGIGVVFGAVGMLGSKALVGLFIRDLEVVELGQKIVCIQLLSAPFDGDDYISFEARSTTHTASLHYECDHEDDGYSNRTCDGRFYFDCSDIGTYGNYL